MEDGLTDMNLSSEREEEVEEKREAGVEDGDEERKGGGLVDYLIHKLVSPLSPKAGDKKVAVVDEEEEEEVETSENERSKRTKTEKDHVGSESTGSGGPVGGGLIKNVISNLFHPSEGQAAENGNKNEQEEAKNVEENEKVKSQEEEGGGGIIDNIVSHLPASLLDNQAAPTTDEASILIHSIIHD